MNKKNIILIASLIILLISSVFVYRGFFTNRNPLDVNISKISINIDIERFDKDLEKLKGKTNPELVAELQKKYGLFFKAFNSEVIGIGGIEYQAYLVYLNTFLSDYAVMEASKSINDVFKSDNWLNDELSLAFRYFKYHFPDYEVPRIITFNGGFNQSIVTGTGFIAIGLDKYLGKDNPLYEMLAIPEFAKVEMIPGRIPFDVMRAYALMEFPYNDSVDNLIYKMIYNGRLLYFLDACFPNRSDMEKIVYNEHQILYCQTFEKDMWTYLVSKKLLFSTDFLLIRKFTENAPFTSDFGNDSPPRTGNWIGWQIVRSYMKNNDISLEELMYETNYQKLLNNSQYNP